MNATIVVALIGAVGGVGGLILGRHRQCRTRGADGVPGEVLHPDDDDDTHRRDTHRQRPGGTALLLLADHLSRVESP